MEAIEKGLLLPELGRVYVHSPAVSLGFNQLFLLLGKNATETK